MRAPVKPKPMSDFERSPATFDQARVALAGATHTRLERARIRRLLKAGELCPLQVIRTPPAPLLTMAVLDLLDVLPRVHRRKTRRLNPIAAEANVNLLTPLGELTTRQREWLVEQVIYMQSATQRMPTRLQGNPFNPDDHHDQFTHQQEAAHHAPPSVPPGTAPRHDRP